MKRMGTRGFDRGLFCGIAGRGAVSPRKTDGKKSNWREKARTSRLRAATSVLVSLRGRGTGAMISECGCLDADDGDQRPIGWPGHYFAGGTVKRREI